MSKVNLEKILKFGIYLTVFMPLIIFSEFLSPFHFGKVIIFSSLVEILTVLYVVLLVRYGKTYLPPRTPLFWSVTLFTLIFGLTTLTSINFYQSFFGTLERMGGWFSFFHFWLFFAIASGVIKKKDDWLTFIKISLGVSLFSVFYGFLQKTDLEWVLGSGGRAKIFGTIGNPALFAGYVIVNAFLALMLYFKPGNSQNEKYFYAGVFLIDALAVLMAGVRGSVLGLVTGIIIFGLFYSNSLNSRRIRKITLAFLILVIVSAGILYFLRNTEFVRENHYLSRYADISLESYTVQTRFWAWQAGFDGWNDSLKTTILGWGPEMFNVPFSKHFNPKFFRGLGSETLFDRAHNQFLEVLFTMGLVGFLSYTLIYFYAFKSLNKLNTNQESNVFRIGLMSSLVAYIIHNSFIFDTAANYLMFFIMLGLINVLTRHTPDDDSYIKDGNVKPKRILTANIAGLTLALIAAVSIYKFEIVPAKANYAATRGIVASWASEHDLAYEKFQEALSYDTFGKYDIRHRYGQYILERANSETIDQKTLDRLFVGIESVRKNAEESPQDYLPYLYLSRLYIMLGREGADSQYNNLALQNSMKALEISPTFIRTYYEIAQAYLNKKDWNKAIEWFEKAVELNPEVSLSKWYLGITHAQAGRYKEGAEIIENSGYGYKGSEADSLRMIEIYFQLNDFQKLSEIYEALVRIDSKNPQYFASLAAAYKEIGEIDKAVEAARTAAKLDPTFAAEAEAFIRSLGR